MKCTEFPAPVAETALSVLTFQVEHILTCDSGEMCKTNANLKGSKCCNVIRKVRLWKFQKGTINRAGDHWARVLLGYYVRFQITWLQSSGVNHLQAIFCFFFGFKFTSVITLHTWIDFDLLLLSFSNRACLLHFQEKLLLCYSFAIQWPVFTPLMIYRYSEGPKLISHLQFLLAVGGDICGTCVTQFLVQ